MVTAENILSARQQSFSVIISSSSPALFYYFGKSTACIKITGTDTHGFPLSVAIKDTNSSNDNVNSFILNPTSNFNYGLIHKIGDSYANNLITITTESSNDITLFIKIDASTLKKILLINVMIFVGEDIPVILEPGVTYLGFVSRNYFTRFGYMAPSCFGIDLQYSGLDVDMNLISLNNFPLKHVHSQSDIPSNFSYVDCSTFNEPYGKQ